MSLTWGTYRTQIRRSILKDPTAATWSNDVLQDLCGWALDTFCAHTAAPTGVTFTAPVAQSLTVPTNLFDNLENTGVLYLTNSSGDVSIIRTALEVPYSDTTVPTYSVWGNEIVLSAELDVTDVLTLRYFAYYDHPTADSDTIDLPQWALNPVAHLIGALAETSLSIQSAGIDRYKDKKDSGTPEDNALRVQQSHLIKVYNEELTRYPRQARESYYQRLLAP